MRINLFRKTWSFWVVARINLFPKVNLSDNAVTYYIER